MNNCSRFVFFSIITFLFLNWIDPGTVYADVRINPNLQRNASGNTVVLWTHRPSEGGYEIEATFSQAGGTWSPSVVLSDTLYQSYDPRVSINGLGDVVAIWSVVIEGNTGLYASMLPLGGSWSAPERITLADENLTGIAQITMDDTGEIVATWPAIISSSPSMLIRAATATFAGAWNSPITLSE